MPLTCTRNIRKDALQPITPQAAEGLDKVPMLALPGPAFPHYNFTAPAPSDFEGEPSGGSSGSVRGGGSGDASVPHVSYPVVPGKAAALRLTVRGQPLYVASFADDLDLVSDSNRECGCANSLSTPTRPLRSTFMQHLICYCFAAPTPSLACSTHV
jgi:hypothetical protein